MEIRITGSNQQTILYNSILPFLILDLPEIINNYQAEYPDIFIKGCSAYLEGLRLQYVTDTIDATVKQCKIFNHSEFFHSGINLLPNEIINAKPFCTFGGLRMLGKSDKIYVDPIGLTAGESVWVDIEYRLIFYTLFT